MAGLKNGHIHKNLNQNDEPQIVTTSMAGLKNGHIHKNLTQK